MVGLLKKLIYLLIMIHKNINKCFKSLNTRLWVMLLYFFGTNGLIVLFRELWKIYHPIIFRIFYAILKRYWYILGIMLIWCSDSNIHTKDYYKTSLNGVYNFLYWYCTSFFEMLLTKKMIRWTNSMNLVFLPLLPNLSLDFLNWRHFGICTYYVVYISPKNKIISPFWLHFARKALKYWILPCDKKLMKIQIFQPAIRNKVTH